MSHDTSETIGALRPRWVLSERGFSNSERLRWASGYRPIRGETVLILGVGFGWDAIAWARRKPAKIIGVDVLPYPENWDTARNYALEHYGVAIEFREFSGTNLDFLDDQSIDICASSAVLEHVKDLRSLMQQAYRLLKPGAFFYSGYGPLWYCGGGDHFSGRGGFETIFNHLLLDRNEYERYFFANILPSDDEYFPEYFKRDLFSHLSTEEYLDIFKGCGFEVDRLVLELSRSSIGFERRWPARFAELVNRYPALRPDDFIIKGNVIRLHKPKSGH